MSESNGLRGRVFRHLAQLNSLTAPQRFVLSAGAYTAAAGLLSFAGWAVDIPRLTDWEDDGVSIQPNATMAATAAGVGLILFALGKRSAVTALGIVVALIGGTALFEYLTGTDLGIDTLILFNRSWGSTGTLAPGRMGPAGASSWTVIGLALALLGLGKSAMVPALGVTALSIAALSLIGVLYGAVPLYSVPWLTTIAVQTSTMIFVAGIALVASVPERQPMLSIAEDSAAGVLTRRVLPLIIFFPLLLGWLVVGGHEAAIYDAPTGTAGLVLTLIGFLCCVLWWGAAAVRGHERALAAASELTAKAELALRGVTDQFFILDDEGRYTFVNDAVCKAAGRTREKLLGRSIWKLFPEIHGTEFEKAVRRVAETQKPENFEYYHEPWQRWFENRAYPAEAKGVAVWVSELTEEKQAEAALGQTRAQLAAELNATRRLQETSTRLIAKADIHSVYEHIVDAAVAIMRSDFASFQIFDAERGELRLMSNRGFSPLAAIFWAQTSVTSQSSASTALWTRKRTIVSDIERCEFMAGSADQATFLENGIRAVQFTPLMSRSGEVLGMLSTHWRDPHEPPERHLRLFDVLARQAADLIERAQSEAKLQRQKADLEEANRRKDEFLAMLAHELRNPLAPIRNATAVLGLVAGNEPRLENARSIIERQTAHMTRLIDDLLDVARITNGTIALRTERIALHEVVQTAAEGARPEIDKHGHTLALDVAEGIWIDADRARMIQVISNLLFNAAKFTPAGGHIALRSVDRGDSCTISVRDSGIGIAPEAQARIFDLFAQEDVSLARSQGGLGLGLTLAKRLVEMHHGRVEVRSDGLGKGAEFTITLPASRGAEVVAQQEQAVSFAPPTAPLSILVVEDNADAAETFRILLELSGHAVKVARDGLEALRLMEEFCPDIAFVDLGLPEINGFEFAQRVCAQETRRRPVLIALSGYGTKADVQRARDAGFDDHMTKPVDHARIQGLLSALAAGGLRRESQPHES